MNISKIIFILLFCFFAHLFKITVFRRIKRLSKKLKKREELLRMGSSILMLGNKGEINLLRLKKEGNSIRTTKK